MKYRELFSCVIKHGKTWWNSWLHFQQFERFKFEIWTWGMSIIREYTRSNYKWYGDHTWMISVHIMPMKYWAFKSDHWWYDGPHYTWLIGPVCLTLPWGPKNAFE